VNIPSKRIAIRQARGVLFAASSAALAVAAHVAAEGELPNIALTALLTLLIGWLGMALAEKTSGFLGVLGVLGFAQLIMHLVLSVLAHQGAHAVNSVSVGSVSVSNVSGSVMLLTHISATGLTALVVTFAESMLLAAVAALRVLLPILWCPPPIPAAPPKRPYTISRDTRVLQTLLSRALPRRGPPLFS
jgi:hypothetical protein